MIISQKEVKINYSAGETSKTIKISLGKRPAKYRSRVFKEVISSAPVDIPSSSYFFDVSGLSGQFVSGSEGLIKYSYDNSDVYEASDVEVKLVFENPNPVLFTISPSEIIFTDKNYNIPQLVSISLNPRSRYCTEYYTDIRIFSESEQDQFYDGMEFYYDISLLVAERRNSFFKCADFTNTNEKYFFPAANFSKKKLKLKKLKIVGSIFNFVYYPVSVITFGEKPYKKADIIDVIVQLNGVDPSLVVLPDEYPEFSPVESNPLEIAYICVGIDGRIFSSSGIIPYNSELLSSSSPSYIDVVISDVWRKSIALSDFVTVGIPSISSDGLNLGPLSNAIIEYDLNEEVLVAEDFLLCNGNGDFAFFYYGILDGDSSVEIGEIFSNGLTFCKPFQLQLEAEITQNALEEQTESITHFLALKKESSELIPICSDFSNETELYCHKSTERGVSCTLKVKRNGSSKKHEEVIIFEENCKIVWWSEAAASENVTPTYEVSSGSVYGQIDLFLSNNETLDSSFIDILEPEAKVLLPFFSVFNSELIHSKYNLASADVTTNQFIIEREIVSTTELLSPVIFNLDLIRKYGFIVDVL